jgi:hypothetical protein
VTTIPLAALFIATHLARIIAKALSVVMGHCAVK